MRPSVCLHVGESGALSVPRARHVLILRRCGNRPLLELPGAHQSGVNALSLATVPREAGREPLLVAVSAGDDQSLRAQWLEVSMPQAHALTWRVSSPRLVFNSYASGQWRTGRRHACRIAATSWAVCVHDSALCAAHIVRITLRSTGSIHPSSRCLHRSRRERPRRATRELLPLRSPPTAQPCEMCGPTGGSRTP